MLAQTASRVYETSVAHTSARQYGAYRTILLITLALCWSPSKLVAYVAPWIVICWLIISNRSPVALRNIALLLMGWVGIVLFHAVLTPGFALHSAALSLLTYGSVFFILAVPGNHLAHERTPSVGMSILRWTVAIQGVWGMVQGISRAIPAGTFDGAVGDAVAGTIRPFGIRPDMSNAMFSINMSLMLIVLLPSLLTQKKGRLAFAIGIVSLIMASTMHVIMLMIISLVFSVFFYYPGYLRKKGGVLVICGLLLVIILIIIMLSGNISTVRNFLRFTIDGRTPRSQIVVRVFGEMIEEYPWMPFLGLGPGQFTSRAGLIGTGRYFGTPANPRPIPLLPHGMSEPFQKYALDLWLSLFFDRAGNFIHVMDNTSSSVKPYFSWLSVYTEFGAIGFASITFVVFLLLQKTKRRVHTPPERLAAASFGAGVILLFMLGMQENYWEVPQAVFLGILLLKVQYAGILNHQHISPPETMPRR